MNCILAAVLLVAAVGPAGQSRSALQKVFCVEVDRARAAGMTDEQIVAMAEAKHVPKWIIAWAKKNCIATEGR